MSSAVEAPSESEKNRSRPYSALGDASLFSTMFFNFMSPLIDLGATKSLTIEDIEELPKEDQTAFVVNKFQKQWMIEQDSALRENREPSLSMALYGAFGSRWKIGVFCIAIWIPIQFCVPFLVRELVEVFDGTNDNVFLGVLYSILLFCCSAASSLLITHRFYQAYRTGSACRTAMMAVIYQKSLKLSNTSRQLSTTGETVNLMSNDAQRLFDFCMFSEFLWMPPLCYVIMLALLSWQIGVAAVAAVFLFALLVPFQLWIGKTSGMSRRSMLKFADQRVKFMNEILQGIRVIKFYAWEEPVMKIVAGFRKSETRHLQNLLLFKTCNMSMLLVWPLIVAAGTIILFVLLGNDLDLATAFLILAFINTIRFPSVVLPMGVNGLAEALVSLRRLKAFLLLPELENDITMPVDMNTSIAVENGYFSWSDAKDSPRVLNNINVCIQKGKLIAIIGVVGSGKSSLVSSILGETHKVSGHVFVRGKIAYCDQTSWIQNMTVRDNILFGTAFDPLAYSNVIQCTNIFSDLEILAAGDQTEIGEKGINLSGGQKARVSIARAAYQRENSDIFIFDDSFAALDVHVANSIFEDCVQSFLSGKTRIVVMNSHLHLLPKFDEIYVMGEGIDGKSQTILGFGSYKEIQRDYGHILSQPVEAEEDQEHFEEISKERFEERQLEVAIPVTRPSGNLMKQEERVTGSVTWKSYSSYLESALAGFYLLGFFLLAFFFITGQLARVGSDVWVTLWANNNLGGGQSDSFWISTFVAWIALTIVLTTIRSYEFVSVCNSASRNLHDAMFKSLLGAPIPTFFDITPIGGIMNRFSKDIDQVDLLLPDFLLIFLQNILQIISVLVLTILASYWIILLLVPVIVLFRYLQKKFKKSSTEIKRLQQISRSPLFSSFSETLNGLSTIRAFGRSNSFILQNSVLLNTHSKAFLTSYMSARWLSIRLDLLSAIVIGVLALLGVLLRSSLDATLISLALIYAIQLMGLVQYTMRTSIDVENTMTSVERLIHFSSLEQEKSYRTSNILPKWPLNGEIVLNNVSLRYRPDLDLILEEISCKIGAAEKVGICGRTGAGKSSLMIALFRIVELEPGGSILIDGVDISNIGLGDLREQLSIIPQDPVLFSGTIRFNLDPFDLYTDEEVWKVLEQTHLKEFVSQLPGRLTARVAEFGDNFSNGQRQLICIGRALLRNTKIIVMDEATSAVDQETDQLIQSTIRDVFRDRTVLTIAHRIETIMDSDKIIVLSKGKIAEMGSPSDLLSRKGEFYSLVHHKDN